jgi:hypothetical protein
MSLSLAPESFFNLSVFEDDKSVSRYTTLSGTMNRRVIEFFRLDLLDACEELVLITLMVGRCFVDLADFRNRTSGLSIWDCAPDFDFEEQDLVIANFFDRILLWLTSGD